MPPEDRFVPRFAAEPPQDLLPYGRWAADACSAGVPRRLPAHRRRGRGPRRARRDRLVPRPHAGTGAPSCPATAPTSTGFELFGYVSYAPGGDGEEPSDFHSVADFTAETAEANPDWQIDLCDEVVGTWRGEQGKAAAMTLVWGRPLVDGGAVVDRRARRPRRRPVRAASRAASRCIAPDDYRGDTLDVQALRPPRRASSRASRSTPTTTRTTTSRRRLTRRATRSVRARRAPTRPPLTLPRARPARSGRPTAACRAAAHTVVGEQVLVDDRARSRRAWPKGGTPPIAKPVCSRTKAASAFVRAEARLVDAVAAAGDRRAAASSPTRKTSDLQIARPRSRSRPRRRPRCACPPGTRWRVLEAAPALTPPRSGTRLAISSSVSGKWQAARLPPSLGSSSGSSTLQTPSAPSGSACGSGSAGGGLVGEGTSPPRTWRCLLAAPAAGRAPGTARQQRAGVRDGAGGRRARRPSASSTILPRYITATRSHTWRTTREVVGDEDDRQPELALELARAG